MNYKLLQIAFLMLVTTVLAYSDDLGKPGSQFLGTWDKVGGGGSDMITIEDNGDQFLVTDGSRKMGAAFKDGFLMVGDTAPITYIKSSDHITFVNGSEYARRSPAIALFNQWTTDMLAKKWDEALAAFTAAIKADPNNTDAYWGRALVYESKGDYNSAIADYTAMIKSNPTNARAYFLRGTVYFYKGDYNSAIADYTATIGIAPDAVPAYGYRGETYYASGHLTESLADFQKYFSFHPNSANKLDESALRAYYFIWLIEVEQTHQTAAPNKELAEALQKDSGVVWPSPIGHYLLGDLSEDGLLKSANVGTAEIVRQQNCQANFYIGMKYFLNGDLLSAKVFLQKSTDTDVKEYPEYQSSKVRLARLSSP